MHRFWEDEGLADELLEEQKKFLKSRQVSSAAVQRRAQNSRPTPPLKEVDSSPFQTSPIAISSVNEHDRAQGTDRVDILGPIVPETLPGVTSLNKPSPFTQPQKKSLFARQREAKRASSPSTEPDAMSSAGNSTSISSDSPQVPFIISDLVERDIVSFDDLKQTSFQRERQKTGFPMPEKLEIPTTTTTGPLDGTYAERSQEPVEPVRVFYSSARDRLDPIRTIEVHEDGVEEPEEELQRGADILQRPPGEFSNLMQEISTENDSSIGKMTVEEIERLQQELAAHLNPKFMAMLKERGQQKALVNKQDAVGAKLAYGASNVTGSIESRGESQGAWKVVDEESVVTSTGVYSIPTSRPTMQTSRKSNFLAEVERKKREWLKPVEHDGKVDYEVNHLTAELYRFDFEGRLMSYPTPKGNVQVESPGATQDLNMLLHHGDNPSEPGYTMDELSHLCRSTHPSQRISALRAIGNIIFKAKHAYYALPQLSQMIPKSGPFEFFPNSLFISHMIQTLNIPITLRMAIDDKSNTIILEALYALHALICSDADENTEILASIPQGACYTYPLEPTDDNKQPFSKKSEWDNQSDVERCQVDLISALLQAGLLARLRYIISSKSSSIICTLVLQIMIRCARHSVDACEHFKSCPNLLKTLKELLIPMSVTSQRPLDPNASLLIRLVQVICQGSRDACEKAISVGLVSACFQFIYLPTESSSTEAIHTMIEALSVFTVCIRYADFKSEIVNVLELLVELITWKSKSTSLPPHTRKHILQSAVWRLLTAMVPMARDIPEGEEIPNFAVLWSHVSPLLPLALTALRTFESTSGTPISSDSDSLLASILEFLAEYFKQLQDYPPRTFEGELGQIKFISEKTLWPFLVRSPYFSQIVVKLSESSSWKSSASYFNVVPAGLYTLRLKSHPTWSWKQQQTLNSSSKKQDGTGISSTTLEQDLHPTLPNDIRGSTILHNASVLLSALKMVSAVSIHNSWLAASLTASDISGPLLSMLEHYSDWAMSCSGSLGSSYATRALHLLAFHAIKLLYRTSIVAQEASLSCLAHLLPGDEDLSEYLISRVALYYQPDGEQDVPVEHSLLRKLETGSGAFMFLLLSLSNGSSDQGSKSRVGKQFEYDPTQRLSLLIDTEFSCQPFGKHWPYFPITSFVKVFNAEMDDHALSRQKAQRDAIHRGVEQHLESQARSSNDDSRVEEDVQLELEEDMELFGDYEDKNLKKTLKQARDLLPALLNFALSMERSNMGFAKKLKRSVKIYSVMQVFTLGPKLFLEASISRVLENLLQIFISKGWEATRLGITLNTALIENLVDHWANESFGDKVVGTAVSLWLSTASELNTAEILASGQLSEVRAVDAALWPAYSALWHLLPTPSSSLHSIYFLENIAMRPLVAEQLLIAICSPHTPRMRSSWNFWYRFTIYQLSRYFISDNSDNVNLWIRTNSLQSLLSDLSSTFSAGERNEVIHDLFALSRDQLLNFSAAPTVDLQNIPTGETSQIPPQLLAEIHKAL